MHIGMRRFSILEKAAVSALRKLSDLLVNFIIPFGNWCIYHSQSPNHCIAIKKNVINAQLFILTVAYHLIINIIVGLKFCGLILF